MKAVIQISMFFLAFALFGCAKNAAPVASNMRIVFPTSEELHRQSLKQSQNKVSTSSVVDMSRICFAVNVTAPDIPSPAPGGCGVPIGLFQGFVAPGGSISMTLPHGTGRKLEVFAYVLEGTTDPCPTGRPDMKGLDISLLSRVGLVPTFDSTAAEVDLDVTVAMPPSGVTIAQQYSLPATCRPPLAPANATAAIALGRAVQSGGSYHANAAVSALQNEIQISGGSYRARLSRRAQ